MLYSEAHQREKRLLLDEVIQLKKEKDIMERDSQRKDSQILQARSELDKSVSSLRNAETKMQMLQNQVRDPVLPLFIQLESREILSLFG